MTDYSATHFNLRCRERGIVKSDLDLLHRGLRWAIEQGRDDLCEMVLKYKDVRYWRFRCPDGIFYAVTGENDNQPRTVVTQSILRKKKWAAKRNRKGGEASKGETP